MQYIDNIIKYLSNLLQWWVIVNPWERGIRIRFGNKVKHLEPGIHWRLPFFDSVYIAGIRDRVISMAVQTVSTKDGVTITLNGTLSYKMSDIVKMYNTLYHPELTLQNIVMSKISDFVTSSSSADCSPSRIGEEVTKTVKSFDYGIEFGDVKIINYAIVKTIRLIQDGSWMSEGYTLNDKR